MTIRTFRLGSAVALVLSLALLAGCGKKKQDPQAKGNGPPPVTTPGGGGLVPVEGGSKPMKDGDKVKPPPKVEAPSVPTFDAVELTRKLAKDPAAARPLANE